MKKLLLFIIISISLIQIQAASAMLPVTFAQKPIIHDMAGGTPQQLNYVIQNNVPAPVPLLAINGFSNPLTRDNNVPNNCGTTLNANKQCTISLLASPQTTGHISQDLIINYGGRYPLKSHIEFNAINPIAFTMIPKIEDMSINSNAQEAKYEVKNISNSPVNLTIPKLNPPLSVTNDCPTPLNPSSTCNVMLKIAPTQPGKIDQTLTVFSGQASISSKVSLNVYSVNVVGANSTPTIYENQGLPASGKATISNNGNLAITLFARLIKPAELNITYANSCKDNIMLPNASCQYTVRFNPTTIDRLKSSDSQEYNFSLEVRFNKDTGAADLTIPFTLIQIPNGKFVTLPANTTNYNQLPSNDINATYKDGNTLYAATLGGLAKSSNNADSWTTYTTFNGLGSNAVNGIYAIGSKIYAATFKGLAISKDSGATWKNKLNGENVKAVYAIGNNIFAATYNGLYISIDNGISWENYFFSPESYRRNIRGVYATGSGNNITVYAATTDNGLQKGTYQPPTNGWVWNKFDNLQSNIANAVYVQGPNIYAATYDGLFISKDNGASWKQYKAELGNKSVTGVYAMGTTVYASTFLGGLYIGRLKPDGTYEWFNYTNNGIGSNIVNGVFAEGANIYAATDNGLSISHDDATTWQNKTIKGDFSDSLGGDIYSIGSTIYAASIEEGGLYISKDGGSSWERSNLNTYTLAVYAVGTGGANTKVYAATFNGLYISNDNGKTWKQYLTLPGKQAYGVYTIGNNIYVATSDGVYISLDNGSSWLPPKLTGKFVRGIYAIGSGSNITVYAATDRSGLWFSPNNGQGWLPMAGLPTNTTSGVYATNTGGKITVYLATDKGLFFKTNSSSWQEMGLADKWINSVYAKASGSTTTIYATTGDGLFVSKYDGTTQLTPWKQYSATDGLPDNDTRAVYANGLYTYVGTIGGLAAGIISRKN